jgi:hypothetical protein
MKLTFVILFALSKWKKIFRSFFFFFINHIVPSITTLKCYVCNSLENEKCANEGNLVESFKQTCPQTTEPYCRKIDQTSNNENDKKNIYIFFCFFVFSRWTKECRTCMWFENRSKIML